VTARLSSDDIARLIDRYQAGEIARMLAEEFGISHSSVKRLLRKHKARRKDCNDGSTS
jgi:DNA invertase Pin-like site-specific DNA recombinase